MPRLLVDEDFDNRILRGLLRRNPALDILRVQDTDLAAADDPTILAWAAQEERVLLTHDVSTMTKFVNERLDAGQSMPGVVAVSKTLPIGTAIEELLLMIEANLPSEWANRIQYVPL